MLFGVYTHYLVRSVRKGPEYPDKKPPETPAPEPEPVPSPAGAPAER